LKEGNKWSSRNYQKARFESESWAAAGIRTRFWSRQKRAKRQDAWGNEVETMNHGQKVKLENGVDGKNGNPKTVLWLKKGKSSETGGKKGCELDG
jgi:hypothetical protein